MVKELRLGGKYKDGLSKKNIFDELREKYPNAFKDFGEWIDWYKDEVGWDSLFHNKEHEVSELEIQTKFHDLPYSMQFGIIMEYMLYRSSIEEPNVGNELIKDMEDINIGTTLFDVFEGTEDFLVSNVNKSITK